MNIFNNVDTDIYKILTSYLDNDTNDTLANYLDNNSNETLANYLDIYEFFINDDDN